MPYTQMDGRFERASRLGHSNAVVRAMADRSSFFVPAEHVGDLTWLSARISRQDDLPRPGSEARLTGVIGVDGSVIVVPVRDGLPSVRYGYAQTAAIWLDIDAMDSQRSERFVDPVALSRAVNSALVSFDFPTAGAYVHEGMSIKDSWRECIDTLFREKKIEVNRLDQSLLQLLFLLHGTPGHPALVLPVNCPTRGCSAKDSIPVSPDGADCPTCGHRLWPTDTLRIHEEVVEDGSNNTPMSRLMQVVELLVTVGLATLLWEQARGTVLNRTLFVTDGPLAVYGPPAKLRARALAYFQSMGSSTPGGVALCGVEKTGTVVDYATALARHDALAAGDLLIVDAKVITAITNAHNPVAYGSETYWGRKFIYRALDGRVVVLTVVPVKGTPYDDHGGQPGPDAYPSLGAILDVVDRTGSSMYRDGLIPVALAHAKAAYPIGIGTDVLRLTARHKLGLAPAPKSDR
ncbi:hypothetical protein [Frankia sp. Cppng1_Ct_nod]|uniref:hypothetical protein n=1 Tax=Frankia sp. Cppng1_Ct_nod TaxID=2897162 RepID=UPI001041BB1C|nr:hypothetical protein [Frankia sp. Cppng1_Ct_nod]